MRTAFIYFLQVIVASGVLYAYYHFFLCNSRFHLYNRFYLLASSILSLIIPLFHIDIYFASRQDIPVVYQLMSDIRAGNAAGFDITSSIFSWERVVPLAFGLIVMLFFTRLIISLVHIMKLKKKHDAEKLENILFINTQEHGTPFSFFRWLFWNKKISVDSPGGQKIFRHELFHIQQKHSWDIIFLELLATFFWINPFFHLIKKETKAIHEFLADRFAAGEENKWEYAELLVMQTLQTRQRLVNPFFHNQIKRRIAMITNSSKSSYQYLRKVMVLPVTFFIVTVVAVNCTSKDIKDVKTDNSEQEIVEQIPTEEKIILLEQKLGELKKLIKDSSYKSAYKEVPDLVIEEKEKLLVQDKSIILPPLAEIEVEAMSSFTGGQKAWQQFLQKNLNSFVPVDKGAPEGKYTVMTQFLVDKNGKISELKALTHFGYGMEEEVLRVMKLSPDWSPAIQKGRPVKTYRRQPVTFSISAE